MGNEKLKIPLPESLKRIESALRLACEVLEPAARPRRYVFVPSMPTNASGKPDREAIAKLTA